MMPYRITLEPSGWTYECTPEQTSLQGALAAGIELRSACRNGTCRACIVHAPGAQVRYTLAWPGLSLDEKEEGYVLPCVACPQGDAVLRESHATRQVAEPTGAGRPIDAD